MKKSKLADKVKGTNSIVESSLYKSLPGGVWYNAKKPEEQVITTMLRDYDGTILFCNRESGQIPEKLEDIAKQGKFISINQVPGYENKPFLADLAVSELKHFAEVTALPYKEIRELWGLERYVKHSEHASDEFKFSKEEIQDHIELQEDLEGEIQKKLGVMRFILKLHRQNNDSRDALEIWRSYNLF